MFSEFHVRTDTGTKEFHSRTVRGKKKSITVFIGTEIWVCQRRGSRSVVDVNIDQLDYFIH